LYVLLLAATWGLFAITATTGARRDGRAALEVLVALCGALVVSAGRMVRDGTSLQGCLLSVSLVAIFILALTRGNPSRMFDPRRPGSKERPASDDEMVSFRRRRKVARIHQGAFILGIIAIFIVYGLSGATILD